MSSNTGSKHVSDQESQQDQGQEKQGEQEQDQEEEELQDDFDDYADDVETIPQLDRDTIKKLGALMCSVEEIAGYLGVDPDVIKDHYKDSWNEGTQAGRVNIRQWQMSQAQGGNIDMLKWLGQQYLKQAPHNK